MNLRIIFCLLASLAKCDVQTSLVSELHRIHSDIHDDMSTADLEAVFETLDKVDFTSGSEFDTDVTNEIETLVDKIRHRLDR